MTTNSDFLKQVLSRLKTFRLEAGLTEKDVENRLILGTGWVASIEVGKIIPTLDVIASLLSVYNKSLTDLVEGAAGSVPKIYRSISAVQKGSGIDINFAYSHYDAIYHLENASVAEFNSVISTLRDGLSQLAAPSANGEAIKTGSVANTFLKAVTTWPNANPSDLWWFLVSRAYCDPYNHPASFSRMDFSQSWKRTGGWALEEILVKHYAPELAKHGINLFIADAGKRQALIAPLSKIGHLEADKMDVMLTVGSGTNEKLIGVVHVKASFAERRSDDVPMSELLVKAGYISPLWTMDCKSMPSSHPVNRGELGEVFDGNGQDQRSAKRADIETRKYFSGCFSYNSRTLPTPATYKQALAKVEVCNFKNPNDNFTQFIVSERNRIRKDLGI
ncbi:MAG TPA: BsaWI family type II restriction enzyme [Chromobacteriaceae bacterium]|nr:BsaWI family type II restriction enzyme [Chromobacteriaceae bacterium]